MLVIPISVLFENMSWFYSSGSYKENYFLFGRWWWRKLAKDFNCPLLITKISINEKNAKAGLAGT
jgi:hypothetical protein